MTILKERPGLDHRLGASAELVTRRLDELLPEAAGPRGRVIEAMRYSALSGGKRLRPFLVIESARLFGLSEEAALNTAAAVEMIHCYSLIHDDLPAMDDSDLRRGHPTVHVRFDDATAVLAGDGLLTEAFAVLADLKTHGDAAVRCELIAGLAKASGAAGMVGGQMIDLSPERDRLDLTGITNLQELKTGALIAFSCKAGAILAQAGQAERQSLRDYAGKLGLAFQIVDDLLDSESTPEALGKPTGQDQAAGKATFVGQLGVAGARDMASGLVDQARRCLDIFGDRASILSQTATFVLERTR
ncbi:polyprenyl synthetase family protein [Denitrobaculum tricleocarpae]|uniref:Polyprenyl synthetase family protein n=1 Tax=Denitrobaculum tricleocarpae TaxID=2591009 RepID=A0A545TXN3_9PROT|nr:farnesyl diphosphate synthase [Denitrobaculum tricleocarpae]TQV81982.1 polyprenyl synthetase family protein [Denitrobaculum tricleocarpae]